MLLADLFLLEVVREGSAPGMGCCVLVGKIVVHYVEVVFFCRQAYEALQQYMLNMYVLERNTGVHGERASSASLCVF